MQQSERAALITGATGGIGAAIALDLSASGMPVALLGRDESKLGALEDRIKGAGGTCLALPCDVTDRAQVNRSIGQALSDLAGIDVLVCGAGINVSDRSLRKLDPADWDRMIATNLTGAFNVMHAVLPHMREQGHGLIVQLSSIAAIRPSTLAGAGYSVSKAGQGVLGMCVGREERGRSVRSTVIYAGEVDTPFLNARSARPGGVSESRREAILKAEDIAAAVRYAVEQPERVRIPELVILPAVDDYM